MSPLITFAPIKVTEAISAAASVFSVIVATVAAFFAYRAYRKQAGQLELALKHDRTWQAAKVTAWVHDIAKSDALNALSANLQQSTYTRAFDYINASDLPVFNVVLIYLDAGNNPVNVYECPILMPIDEPEQEWLSIHRLFPASALFAAEGLESLPEEIREASSRNGNRRWRDSEQDDGSRGVTTRKTREDIYNSVSQEMEHVHRTGAIYFSDSEGNRWKRSLAGSLELVQLA